MGNLIDFPTRERAYVTEWQGFYSAARVSRLTGVPVSTLNEWRRRGISRPSLLMREGDHVLAEGFSYADVTLVRILKALRDKHLDFDDAGRAIRHLYDRLGPPSKGWANEHVYVIGNHIYVDRPDDWEVTDATGMGQKVMDMGDLFEELRQSDEGASILVPLRFQKFVHIDPQVMGGEPVVRDTRLPTATVVTMLKRYKTIDKLAQLYKPIPREKIEKAIEYERELDSEQGRCNGYGQSCNGMYRLQPR